MSKKIIGYFVCVNGAIWTVFSEEDQLTTNMGVNIALSQKNEVQILIDDAGETLIEEEYVLWPSLNALAVAIEGEPVSKDRPSTR